MKMNIDLLKTQFNKTLEEKLSKLFEIQIIQGCNDVPLLTRWKLVVRPAFRIYLHKFHRSDEERAVHTIPLVFYRLF